jgi:hypothetical protein
MPGISTAIIGKALALSFDDGKWTSFETPKGQRIVQFSGTINVTLHEAAVRQFLYGGQPNAQEPVTSLPPETRQNLAAVAAVAGLVLGSV